MGQINLGEPVTVNPNKMLALLRPVLRSVLKNITSGDETEEMEKFFRKYGVLESATFYRGTKEGDGEIYMTYDPSKMDNASIDVVNSQMDDTSSTPSIPVEELALGNQEEIKRNALDKLMVPSLGLGVLRFKMHGDIQIKVTNVVSGDETSFWRDSWELLLVPLFGKEEMGGYYFQRGDYSNIAYEGITRLRGCYEADTQIDCDNAADSIVALLDSKRHEKDEEEKIAHRNAIPGLKDSIDKTIKIIEKREPWYLTRFTDAVEYGLECFSKIQTSSPEGRYQLLIEEFLMLKSINSGISDEPSHSICVEYSEHETCSHTRDGDVKECHNPCIKYRTEGRDHASEEAVMNDVKRSCENAGKLDGQ